MYFTAETLATNRRLQGHWNELWANRNIWNQHHDMMVNAYRSSMTPEMLAANAIGGFTREFWAELDRQVIQLRDQEIGMEIINDLMSVQTILPIGKTAKLYNVTGDIADDVSVSIDGQAPYSFDHTDYDSDGDPIPVFTAGYGVNWRHAAGLNTVGIDLMLDSQATTPVFQVNARRMEISGLHLIGAGTVTPFYKNVCPAGQYIRVKSFRCNNTGGLVFDVQDTIDTKFDQIYCSKASGGFLRAGWSNTEKGGWNHSTAIEITNSNFSSNTTVDVLQLIRCGQSLMYNVWFSNNEYTFDISQGGWILNTVIMENSTYPAKTKWAKTVEFNCRYAQGATLDDTLSGYTPDMDKGKSLPPSVTNAMDQGRTSITATGASMRSGLAAYFTYSDTVLKNSNNAETWFYVGRIVLPVLGHTAIVRFLGASGWETTATPVTRPGSTNFGGGEARLYVEMKKPNDATTGTIEAHWHGEGGTPVKEIRIVHSWQTIHIYVKVAQYARATGVFIETNSIPRMNSGSPFYFVPSNSQLSNVDDIANNVAVSRRWAINSGTYGGNGFGMDLDSGDLLLDSSSVKSVSATDWISIFINGQKRYVQYQEFNDAIRFPRYTYAELPDPAKTTYGMCFCIDTIRTPKMQMLYASNDGMWYPVNNPSESWKPI